MSDEKVEERQELLVVNGVTGPVHGGLMRAILPLDKLVPVDWNPNEMPKKEYELLVETIKESGFIDPITVVPRPDGETFAINGGAHRWKACQEAGLKEVPVDILIDDRWQDEDLQKFQNVRSNVLHGKMNPEKFLALYNEMVNKYGKEAVTRKMGYADDAGIKKIVKSIAREMKASLPPEMAKQFEEQAKEARTINDLERIIQHLFQEHGDSLKYNFMILSWGGKEHVYVAMSKKVWQAMKKIMSASRTGEVDINELIGEALESVAAGLSKPKNGDSKGKDEEVRF